MKSAFRAFFTLFLFASSPAARAENVASPSAASPIVEQADEAQFHFLRGNRAYQDKRFEDALASYYLSNRLVPNRNVQFNIARCLDRLARYDESYRAWTTLLDQSLPDKERQAVRDAIDQLRPHLALLDIATTPPGATVFAGRRDLGALGVTPKSLSLPAGLTKIILERDGYRPVELVAEPSKGKQIKLSATLQRIFGEIDIRRVPEDAEIRRNFLDGEVLRRGPGTAKILPGPSVLFVSAPGFQTERVVVDVLADAVVPVDVLMSPAVAPAGTLVVRANIASALIRIDGKEAGFAPAVIEGVAAGSRRIEILEEGRQPFRETVEVKQGERAFVDAHLAHADSEVTAATKSAVASESAPASITIITADEIAAFGYTTLVEAVNAVRGTFTSNDRSYESIGFGGFSPPGDYTKRVLVLVDGHPINDVVTGQGYVGHDFDVDLANVARIEIVRGPGSVLYGTGALFGVINVVTRRAGEGMHAAVNTTAGTMGVASARATASARAGNADVMVSVGAMNSDGDIRFVVPADVNTSVPQTVLNADGERAYHADVVGHLGPFSLRAGFNDRKKNLPTDAYDTRPWLGTSYQEDRRGYAEIRLDEDIQHFHLAARAAYDKSAFHGHYVGDQTAGDPTSDEDIGAQWITGEVRLETPVFLHQRFTLGSEVAKQIQLETVAPVPKDLIVSAYLVDDIQVTNRLHVNAGLRSDSYTKSFGTTLNPRFALIGKPYLQGNTKLLIGRSFRAPSPNERADTTDGNLRPEVMSSVEIEHTHVVSDDVRLVGALFANRLNDLIFEVNDPQAGIIFQNKTNQVRSVGAEGELRWEPGGGTLFSVSLTRQKVEELSPQGNSPFLNAPDTLFKVRALCPLVGLALRFGTELVLDSGRHFRQTDANAPAADDRVDDAVLWNLSLSGEYRAFHLHYFAGMFNVLDVHDPRAGIPTSIDFPLALIPRYGRSMRAGLAWAF
jgi:outer membrane receptor protein involved in Fe transport